MRGFDKLTHRSVPELVEGTSSRLNFTNHQSQINLFSALRAIERFTEPFFITKKIQKLA
jgi:hypothetical protein